MKTYYKVTTPDLKSCATTYYNIPEEYKVQYKIGEFVYGPDNTPLLVFKSHLDAINFLPYTPGRNPKIFKCEVKNPRKIKYLSYLAHLSDFLNFLKNKKTKKKQNEYKVFEVPYGTYAVNAVKLLEEI